MGHACAARISHASVPAFQSAAFRWGGWLKENPAFEPTEECLSHSDIAANESINSTFTAQCLQSAGVRYNVLPTVARDASGVAASSSRDVVWQAFPGMRQPGDLFLATPSHPLSLACPPAQSFVPPPHVGFTPHVSCGFLFAEVAALRFEPHISWVDRFHGMDISNEVMQIRLQVSFSR